MPHHSILNLRHLPGILPANAAAALLGYNEAALSVLVSAGHLKAMGFGARTAENQFASNYILSVMDSESWYDKADEILASSRLP